MTFHKIVFNCHLKVNLEVVEWGLGKIIFENIFNRPVEEYIHDFIVDDLLLSRLHDVFSDIFDYYFTEA